MSQSIRERLLSRPGFVEREIAGVGKVQIRHLKTGEVMALSEEPDKSASIHRLVALGALDERGEPIFKSPDELKGIDWVIVKGISDAVMEVNGLNPASKTELP